MIKGNTLKALIFDVDGTMVDNADYHFNAWVEFARRHNISITKQYYMENIHARSNDKNIRGLFGNNIDDNSIEKLSEEKEIIYRRTFRPVIREIPGLCSLLKDLQLNNIPCGAASNSPKANVDMVLDELDIRKYFKTVIDRDMVTTGKPDPQILLLASGNLNAKTHETVVFEDSASGFKAAENANMRYVVITAGADPEDLKHARNASGIYPDFTGITIDTINSILES